MVRLGSDSLQLIGTKQDPKGSQVLTELFYRPISHGSFHVKPMSYVVSSVHAGLPFLILTQFGQTLYWGKGSAWQAAKLKDEIHGPN